MTGPTVVSWRCGLDRAERGLEGGGQRADLARSG